MSSTKNTFSIDIAQELCILTLVSVSRVVCYSNSPSFFITVVLIFKPAFYRTVFFLSNDLISVSHAPAEPLQHHCRTSNTYPRDSGYFAIVCAYQRPSEFWNKLGKQWRETTCQCKEITLCWINWVRKLTGRTFCGSPVKLRLSTALEQNQEMTTVTGSLRSSLSHHWT